MYTKSHTNAHNYAWKQLAIHKSFARDHIPFSVVPIMYPKQSPLIGPHGIKSGVKVLSDMYGETLLPIYIMYF